MIDVDVKKDICLMCLELQKSFYDRAWNLGTIYAGARSSKSQIRFYDKKQRENTLDMKLKI